MAAQRTHLTLLWEDNARSLEGVDFEGWMGFDKEVGEKSILGGSMAGAKSQRGQSRLSLEELGSAAVQDT